MVDFLQRIPTMWQNASAAGLWRPLDVVNWHRMVWPLYRRRGATAHGDVFRILFEIFSRTRFTYQPIPVQSARIRIPGRSAARSGQRVALFVDTPDHLSGVATTIGQWVTQAARRGLDLTVFHCGERDIFPGAVRFPPVGLIRIAAYPGLDLRLPDVAQAMEVMREHGADLCHLSTPGPMGLLGLRAARENGVPTCGTYHTDFPGYARQLTGDPSLETAAWQMMHWFYGQIDAVAAPTPAVRDHLIEHGFDATSLHVVGRGVPLHLFSPQWRDPALRSRWHHDRPVKLLYVGRISREKNLECLARAFRLLAGRRGDVALIVVGDGPYRAAMEDELAGLPVCFAGTLRGDELARAYASCDLFVFPSETDTFGVVLLEAQASGLPCVVSNRGGPRDVVKDGITGRIVDPMRPDTLADTLAEMTARRERLAELGRAAHDDARRYSPEAAFASFWSFLSGSAVRDAIGASREAS